MVLATPEVICPLSQLSKAYALAGVKASHVNLAWRKVRVYDLPA